MFLRGLPDLQVPQLLQGLITLAVEWQNPEVER